MDLLNLITKIIRKDDNGDYYIENSVLDSLNLNKSDIRSLYYILKKYNISIKNKLTNEKETKKIFNFTYYNEFGHIIGINYESFNEFLEYFILDNIIMKYIINDITGEKELIPTIELSSLLGLRLNDIEKEYALDYLNKKNIIVFNSDMSLEDRKTYFDYRDSLFSKTLNKKEFEEKIALYLLTKDPIIREQLILSKLHLVPFIAWKYSLWYEMDINELESYGYEGLLLALDKYNPSLGYSFSKYAVSYINGYIKSGIQELEFNKKNDFTSAFLRVKKDIEEKHQSKIEDNPELIDEIVGTLIENNEINERNYELTKRRINLLLANSLDEINDTVWTNSNNDMEDEIIAINDYYLLKDKINSILKTLLPIEEQVICLRFGLDGDGIHSRNEIAQNLNKTEDNIRSIEEKALKKLRHPSRDREIHSFIHSEFPSEEMISKRK